ncbi:DUF1127 domain-containing protein [Bosea sp. CS1GBMeth4]|uniref:DUF1127 domain-containing protein n=1 Tax=Bosea sp. CS1GBMeth4 TaxID=1892849 RepID=UPI001645667F|nr:DUF1127 domain-containing protein [Bosea sp. CS1GBMeth4]
MISIIIGSAKPVFAVALGRCLGAIGRWLQSHREHRILREMSERELRDLGLRDSELRDRAAAPFPGDPTGIISLGAGRRRGLAGGASVDEALRGLGMGAPGERIAREPDSAGSARVVRLRAAE